MRKQPAQWELGIFFAALAAVAFWSGGGGEKRAAAAPENTFSAADSILPVKTIGPPAPWMRVSHDDSTWQHRLTPESYRVARLGEDEPSRPGELDEEAEGVYRCVCCGQPLFHSNAKSTSGNGWRGFERCIGDDEAPSAQNNRLGSMWSEVVCGGCGAHLGYLFLDEKSPTGVLYRINAAALAPGFGRVGIAGSSVRAPGGGGTSIPYGGWGLGHGYSRRFGFSLPSGNVFVEDRKR